MDSEDGSVFVKHLASFVRANEKELANALQFSRPQKPHRDGTSTSPTERSATSPVTASTGLAAALSLSTLGLTASPPTKAVTLPLTPHHLFYLLSKFEDLDIPVGPMTVRLENLHESATYNYVSFLGQSRGPGSRGSDAVSTRSRNSVRSVVSSFQSILSNLSFGGSFEARAERQRIAFEADLKYLYSGFTKIPSLYLGPIYKASMIRGYEEFPLDSAVPLFVFKNLQSLEINDLDFRKFYGWHQLADNLRTLVLRKASVDQPSDVLVDIVLDDADGRRRRTTRRDRSALSTPITSSMTNSSSRFHVPVGAQVKDRVVSGSGSPGSPDTGEEGPPVPPKNADSTSRRSKHMSLQLDTAAVQKVARPGPSRSATQNRNSHKSRRSDSTSTPMGPSDSWGRRGSMPNIFLSGLVAPPKWRFLKHFGLPDNGLVELPGKAFPSLENTLRSLDLSNNQFKTIPDGVATLTSLRSLNLANNVIDDLRSLKHSPLPAITVLNLRANRLTELAGIETLYPLEKLDVRQNLIKDPLELQRLTGMPDIRALYVEGNPFTKTHRDYRVTIFNFFRATPGYTEDLEIDGIGPSYSEKRRLIERAPIPQSVPVVKPADVTLPVVTVGKPDVVAGEPARPSPRLVVCKSNCSHTSYKRRSTKRRIVDLSMVEPSSSSVTTQPLLPALEEGPNMSETMASGDSTGDVDVKDNDPPGTSAAQSSSIDSEHPITPDVVCETTIPSDPKSTKARILRVQPEGERSSWSVSRICNTDEACDRGFNTIRDESRKQSWEQPRPSFKEQDLCSTPSLVPRSVSHMTLVSGRTAS